MRNLQGFWLEYSTNKEYCQDERLRSQNLSYLSKMGFFSKAKCMINGIKVKVKVSQLCPTLCDPMNYPWNSLGQNTGVGSLSLLQGIFPTQGLNPGLSHCRGILYELGHKGSPRILEWVAKIWAHSRSWWWDREAWHAAVHRVKKVRHYWATELNWPEPIPSHVDLPDPGIEPGSPALKAESLSTELSGKPKWHKIITFYLFAYFLFWLCWVFIAARLFL